SAVASAVGVAEYPSEIVLYRVRVGSTARDAVAVALAVPDIVVDTAVSSADSGVIPALRCRVRPPSTDPENVLVRSNSPVALSEMRGVRVTSPSRVTGTGPRKNVVRASGRCASNSSSTVEMSPFALPLSPTDISAEPRREVLIVQSLSNRE